jgi:molybdate transport system ATP-binding protein
VTTLLSIALQLELADFALRVEFESRARCVGIFGPSGSGKTSLLEAIAGWRKGLRGRIAVGERVLHDDTRGIRCALHERGIGYVPQDALLFPHWSVERNLREAARRPIPNAGPERAASADFSRAVEVLGLSQLLARVPATLSGGERQRVALARALVSRPALLLFDEPLGGVDVELRRRILPWLVRMRDATEIPIVFVSHDPTEVQVLCDEVVVLDRGELRAQGPSGITLRRHLAGQERFENVFEGVVVEVGASTACVDVGGAHVHVTRGRLAQGARVSFALGSDEVLLALTRPSGISARNVLAARVEALTTCSEGSRIDLALHAPTYVPLSATLSSEAVAQLSITAGLELFAVFKSSSCGLLATSD